MHSKKNLLNVKARGEIFFNRSRQIQCSTSISGQLKKQRMGWGEALQQDKDCAEETTCSNYAKPELVDIVNDRKQDVKGLSKWSASYRASG
jgi:hypothetical protein